MVPEADAVTKVVAEIAVRIRDLSRFRLWVWELRQLAERLRSEGSPHADTLDRLLDRIEGGGDDD